ncbi:hypothetical protein Q9966_015941 [Columba livia]|nr:hypothetical protein Q9966_015941 [Columba livia]
MTIPALFIGVGDTAGGIVPSKDGDATRAGTWGRPRVPVSLMWWHQDTATCPHVTDAVTRCGQMSPLLRRWHRDAAACPLSPTRVPAVASGQSHMSPLSPLVTRVATAMASGGSHCPPCHQHGHSDDMRTKPHVPFVPSCHQCDHGDGTRMKPHVPFVPSCHQRGHSDGIRWQSLSPLSPTRSQR